MMPATPPYAVRRRSVAAFARGEFLALLAMTAILVTAAVAAGVSFHKNASGAQEFANSLSDEMRLLDFFSVDLGRAATLPGPAQDTMAVPSPAFDPDDQGMQIALPNEYSFAANDPGHRSPIANVLAKRDPAFSQPGVRPASQEATPKAVYRFTSGSITRSDPWQPLVYDSSKGQYVDSGPVTIATNMESFPTIEVDTTSTKNLRYRVKFHCFVRSPDKTKTPDEDSITLHGVTFIRSRDYPR